MVGFEVFDMLEQFERDLAIVEKALEQSLSNHNVLIGQKQTILHYIAKAKEVSDSIDKMADTVETVVEAVPE